MTDERPVPVRTTARRFLFLLCLAVVLVRATFVPQPLRNDEGGYLLVARQWHSGGEFLYGDYFVDRPPLLLLLFRVAALTEWDQAVRLLAVPFVLLFVLAGWRAGSLLAGPVGGRWAALVAAGLLCSPALGADQADGELFGATLVLVSIALGLSAWNADSAGRRMWLSAAAGAIGAAAPLVKQNLLECLLFLVVLLAVASRHPDASLRRRVGAVAAPALGGALVVGALFLLWLTTTGSPPGDAFYELVGFRGAAFDVIWSSRPDATISRATLVVALGLVTGLLPAVVIWLVRARRRPRSPESTAVTALLAFGLVAIAAGGSFWPPYLLQLAPAVVLGAALLAPASTTDGRWMRISIRMLVATALVSTVVVVAGYPAVPSDRSSRRIGEWLADSKQPGDTAAVLYGLPSVLEVADMPSPYPYLWSAPMRTEDPDQTRLRATLAGPTAPTWVVQVSPVNSWGIDGESRLRDLIDQRYRVAASICGHRVWLRQDAIRELSAPPAC
jgi:hypothetical protein